MPQTPHQRSAVPHWRHCRLNECERQSSVTFAAPHVLRLAHGLTSSFTFSTYVRRGGTRRARATTPTSARRRAPRSAGSPNAPTSGSPRAHGARGNVEFLSIEATEPSIDHGRRPVADASRAADPRLRYSRVPWPAAARAGSGGSPRATTEALFRLARTWSSG